MFEYKHINLLINKKEESVLNEKKLNYSEKDKNQRPRTNKTKMQIQ